MDAEKALVLARRGARVFFVGIKGTGMCALAEFMRYEGIRVSGSDRADVFYTDAILRELGIPWVESFAPEALPADIDLLVYSAAYSPETNPQLALAERRGVPMLKYPDALGAYSARFDSSGIAGVHGKTTTTAMTGSLIRALNLPARVLVGSAVGGFGGRSTLCLGGRFLVAETCEYRRHFLAFHPRRIVLTGVESDHQDYYPDYASIRDAFLDYARKLPPGGALIYCADDPGAGEVAKTVGGEGRGIRLASYGFNAEGPFKIGDYRAQGERVFFRLGGFTGEFRLRVPGRHSALNAAAALALASELAREEWGGGWTPEQLEKARQALEEFGGTKRRSEILGEAGGILFMDDYGHHPTAIKTTLAGLKEFYPNRRLVVSFMSHTYSRTAALFDDFAGAFENADILFLHRIYASAREDKEGFAGRSGISGKALFEKVKTNKAGDGVFYVEEPPDAAEPLKRILRQGDLFLTMGAGDNWKLGTALLECYQNREAAL